MKAIVAFAAVAVLSPLAAAQQKQQVLIHEGIAAVHAPAGQAAPAAGVRIVSMQTAAVKGAPYSAEAVTETVQILADGNRITNTSRGMQYRDSEGRTRIDNTISPVGMWVPAGTREMTFSNITDPVSGDHYMLDHSRRTAMKSPLPPLLKHAGTTGAARDVRIEVKRNMGVRAGEGALFTAPAPPPPGDVLVGPGPAVMMFHGVEGGPGPALKKETLGTRVIEGLECEGTRETLTIEAGQIGNERAIQTVTERWYSPRLQQDVLRKTADPRFGEMTFRLSGVTLGDPPRSLFEVPADYKVEDATKSIQFIKPEAKQ